VIPEALRRAAGREECRAILPDRSGYLVMLGDTSEGVGCSVCGCAMGFAIVRQRIAGDRIVTEYGHITCLPEPAAAA